MSPAQGRSLRLEIEKPEPGSAPLERRGGRERAQGGEGHLKEAGWLRQGSPGPMCKELSPIMGASRIGQQEK